MRRGQWSILFAGELRRPALNPIGLRRGQAADNLPSEALSSHFLTCPLSLHSHRRLSR